MSLRLEGFKEAIVFTEDSLGSKQNRKLHHRNPLFYLLQIHEAKHHERGTDFKRLALYQPWLGGDRKKCPFRELLTTSLRS